MSCSIFVNMHGLAVDGVCRLGKSPKTMCFFGGAASLIFAVHMSGFCRKLHYFALSGLKCKHKSFLDRNCGFKYTQHM